MAVYTDLALINPSNQALATDLDAIHQSILAILNTRKGERLFRPLFGNSLEDSLFELIDDITSLEVFRRIVEDIDRQEPRVRVITQDTSVTPDPVNKVYKVFLVLQPLGLTEDRITFQGELSQRVA
jgi:phage baseplate assembly protein W